MSRVLTNEQNYYNIADTIRQMKNVNTTYKPREMASALKDIYSNEVEGVLPLSFESNGMPLIDYRIDGASGGVGERTKNLLQNTATSQTINGVTFTVNEDKSITCNGTAGRTTQYVFSDNTIYENCVLSGCPSGGGYNNYLLRFRGTGGEQIAETGSGKPISNVEGYVEIRLNTGYTCDNLTFYPMIRLASIQDDTYEPYGYKVPVVVSGKNLFNENAITNEILRDNDGTTNSNNNWRCSNFINIPQNNNNILISWESDSAYFQAKIAFYDNQKNFISLSNYGINNTYLITFNLPNNCEFIRFSYSQTVNNVPANRHNIQIILGSTTTDYEPYHEPTTTNIYLDEPIEENESISLSDTNVDIPTIDGTNVLTIDTTIQPSNVYVQIAKNNVIKNWEEIGYFIEPNIINNSFNYAKQIMQNWDNTLTDYTRKFAGDLNLRIMPLVDTLNGVNFSNMFLDCKCLVAIEKLNLSNGVNFNSMFSGCYSLPVVPQLNISKGMSFYCMFSNCYSLTTIPQLNASSGLNFDGIFSSCYCLVNFGGLLNIGQAYETSESSNSYGYELDLSSCWQLTHDSLMNVINGLYDIATKGCNTQQLVIGSTNLAKLTAEEIAIATNKGWSVS